jgi:hypothetical protein
LGSSCLHLCWRCDSNLWFQWIQIKKRYYQESLLKKKIRTSENSSIQNLVWEISPVYYLRLSQIYLLLQVRKPMLVSGRILIMEDSRITLWKSHWLSIYRNETTNFWKSLHYPFRRRKILYSFFTRSLKSRKLKQHFPFIKNGWTAQKNKI